jgi:hybrid cluster-associated redox disulfide protein
VDEDAAFSPDDVVASVLARWPQSLRVFIDRRMACPGCPMMRFMTLAEAARAYDMAVDDLIRALETACRG